MAGLWTSTLRAVLVLALPSALASCTAGGDSAVECVSELRLDGQSYYGFGDLKRDPPTTGRRATAIIPTCHDSGPGEADDATKVTVLELDDIPMSDAVLADDGLYVRRGLDVPAAATIWFTAPTCTTLGTFDLTADWIGVLDEDGQTAGRDLPPPYVLDVHVTDGPTAYRGTTIKLHATDTTAPELDHDDVTSTLWKGGQIRARVSCDDGRFTALSLRVRRPAQ